MRLGGSGKGLGVIAAPRAYRHFAQPVHLPSWYVVARSNQVKGRPVSRRAFGRRLVLFRREGEVRALDGSCAHLGADLGQASMGRDGTLRCPFHGWRYREDGACLGPSTERRLRRWPVQERWGFVWVFNGPAPLFDLPAPCFEGLAVRGPQRFTAAHPHLVIANGLDVAHYDGLHQVELTAPPRLEVTPPHIVRVEIEGRPRVGWMRRVVGSSVRASFETVGANLALARLEGQARFAVLFAAQMVEGGTRSDGVIFVPRPYGANLLRTVLAMRAMLADDRRVLQGLDFVPRFTEGDGPLMAFADVAERLEPSC